MTPVSEPVASPAERTDAALTTDGERIGGDRGAFTGRALVMGALLTAFLAWLAPYSIYRLFSSRIHYGVLTPGSVAVAVLLVAINHAISRRRPRAALNAGELVIVIAMTWIGTAALFQLGAIDSMIAVMASPAYFATPENRWAEIFLPHMPAWTIPSNGTGAVRDFYNGLPAGAPIPWGVWIAPLFWWGTFIGATLGAMACVMTMVHEQWHDHEKLTFPMADIPLAIVGGKTERGWTPGWMRSRLFHVGAGIPFAIIAWNILNGFDPSFPKIAFSQVGGGIALFGMTDFQTKVDFFTIGLAYYAPLNVLHGFWIGRLVIGAEIGLGRRFGFGAGANAINDPWSEWGTATAAWQCAGGLIVFVLWGFWIGREHYRRVLKSAVNGEVALPDRLRRRYRWAVWGLAGFLGYMAFWLHAIGMAWPVICLFLPVAILLNLGISKVIVESCVLYAENPVAAQTVVMQTLGTTGLPHATLTAFALSYIAFRSNSGMMMPQVGYSERMGDEHGVPRGRLIGALGLAVFIAFTTAIGTVIVLAYNVGAFNFPSLAYREAHNWVYGSAALRGDFRFGPDPYRLGFFGFGAALMAAVIAIRTRWYGFWLHPVGLTFATTSVAGLMLLNIFLAWAAKATLERIGGIALVNRAKPFFLGLVCGHALGVALGIAVDAIWFPGQGHYVTTGW